MSLDMRLGDSGSPEQSRQHLAPLIVPVMMMALTGFGWWPFSIPGSIVFVGIVFIAVGRTWERSPRREPWYTSRL